MNSTPRQTSPVRSVGSLLNGIPHARLLALSLGAAILTVALKLAAYKLTNSVGLLSDAVESGANVLASLAAIYALWFSSQPADRSHPYGHEKIEFFSSGVEGALILFAAMAIAFSAIIHLSHPVLPQQIEIGVAVSMVSAAINFAVGRALLRVGKRENSIVLEADGHHLMTDVWTTVGVVAGLMLAKWTRWAWIDPVLALLVALNIVRIGVMLLRRSVDGLMDRALEDAQVQTIRETIERVLDVGTTYHALRTRRAGSRLFAEYHLLVPGRFSVARAHGLEMEIGRALKAAIPDLEVTSHIEPIEEPLAWNDARWQDEREENLKLREEVLAETSAE